MQKNKRKGQIVVELVLILPVFFLVVFMIMELGNIAFQTILAHHVAYEVARIGSLTARTNMGAELPMEEHLKKMLPRAFLQYREEATLPDPQTFGETVNHDLVVTVNYPAPLIFPMTSVLFSNSAGPVKKKISSPVRWIKAEVRMPVEQPLFK